MLRADLRVIVKFAASVDTQYVNLAVDGRVRKRIDAMPMVVQTLHELKPLQPNH